MTADPALVRIARELERTQPRYGACRAPSCTAWSDVPAWDAVAAVRIYDMTHDADALRTAEAAYRFVADSKVFARGACPDVPYQRPHAESGGLKTLETAANLALAAALLAERTGFAHYRVEAARLYAAARSRFLDARVPLYTVYVFDDGRRCVALPHRFFASANGAMIETGLVLARITGDERYAADARATAHGVRALDDARGIFTDLQAENDVVEPLVVAMFELARGGDAFAAEWIARNAAAARGARRADGAYGRFFDGPPPLGTVTQWQVNGGLALAVARSSLTLRQAQGDNERGAGEPPGGERRGGERPRVETRGGERSRVETRGGERPRVETAGGDGPGSAGDGWRGARAVPAPIARLPATVRFTGSGVALIGTLGERCCEPGRVRVLIDGVETFDRTGIWQNKSSLGRALPDTILFAWRWRRPGARTIRLEADAPNPKEGGPYLGALRMLVAP